MAEAHGKGACLPHDNPEVKTERGRIWGPSTQGHAPRPNFLPQASPPEGSTSSLIMPRLVNKPCNTCTLGVIPDPNYSRAQYACGTEELTLVQ